MNRLILAAALAAGCTLVSSAPALGAARHYDCSKAGNANKSACKGKTTAAAPKAEAKAKPVKAAKATARAPKVMAAKPAPQPGLLQRMSNAMHSSKPAATPAAAPRKATKASASAENSNPAGAIAQCKDGTYSHAKSRTGACSRHGGVAKWS